ncbi:hypothetical protein OROHE_003326 [Orobanche hederae]
MRDEGTCQRRKLGELSFISPFSSSLSTDPIDREEARAAELAASPDRTGVADLSLRGPLVDWSGEDGGGEAVGSPGAQEVEAALTEVVGTSGKEAEVELPVERRKSHLLITEGNLLTAGLRPTQLCPNLVSSRAKTAPARKETPAERVERLAAERRRGAAKRKRSDAEAEISISRTEIVPRAEEFILPSP